MDEADPEEIVECGGLLGGITAYHIRRLCESPWEGGGGYTPEQAGQMTLDQVWFRLCNLDLLKHAGDRLKKKEAEGLPEGEGMLVRLEDGTLKRLPVAAKSLVKQLKVQPAKEGRRARRRRLKNENH